MGNMSYCRFNNTNLALVDCNDAIEDAMNGDTDIFWSELNDYERNAIHEMTLNCKNFIANAGELLDMLSDEQTK